MATPAAILETVVRANTTAAVRDLRQYDSYLHRVDKSSVSTTARTNTLGKATSSLGGRMASAARYAAGAAAAYVSIAQAKAAVTTTQDLAKTTAGLNRNLGLTVKEGSRWASVAKSRDIDAKSLTMSFTTLSRRVVEAGHALREGGGAAETAMVPFTRLGLSQRDVLKGSKDLGSFLPRLADAFGEAEGGAKRQASAQQLLGRGYATILPLFASGAEGLKEQQKWADKYGTTLNQKTLKAQMDLVQAQRETKVAWLGLQVAFAKFVTPALEKANDQFQKIAAIMADDSLTSEEKWKRIGGIIEKWADKALDAFLKILPILVERAGEAAPKIAGAFVEGFLKAPILGQLLLGGWLLSKMGGMGAVAKIGTSLGTSIGKFAGPAAAVAIGAAIGIEFSKTDWADKHIHHMSDLTKKIAEELGTTLSQAQKVEQWMKNHPGLSAPEAFDAMRDAAREARQDVLNNIDILRNRWGASLQEIKQRTQQNMGDIRKTMDENSMRGRIAIMNNFDAAVDAIKRSMDAGETSAKAGAKAIHQVLIKQLKSYGISDPEGFLNRSESVRNTGGEGHRGLQGGGMVPGYGTGDKVPLHIGGKMAAMVEPGEYVSVANRKATAALMDANAMIPRFAKGGVIEQALGPYTIPPIQYDPNHAGGNSHLHLDFFTPEQAITVGKQMQKMGWTIAEYSGSYGGFGGLTVQHQSPGHYDGTAFDANTAANETRSQVAAIAKILNGGVASAVGGAVAKAIDLKLPRFEGTNGLGGMVAQGLNNSAAAIEQVIGKRVAAKVGNTTSADGGLLSGSGDVEKVFAETAKKLSTSKTATLALGMAGYAESGMRDLAGGDSTSQGALQLLSSTAAGMGIDPHDEAAIASAFLLKGYYGRGGANSLAASGLPAHMVAQSVQGSAFSDGSNYLAQAGSARSWMSRFGLKQGGIIAKLAEGGGLNFGANPVRGKVSWFSDSQTASGTSAATNKGLALNIDPGTDSGWNNSKTRKWLKDAQDFQVSIGSHKAIMPVIDLGPAGSTGRAIDVSKPGVKALGYTTSNFPTDAMGVARRIKSRGGGGENGGGGNGGRGGRNGAEPPGPESYSPADIPKKILDMVEAHQGAIKLLDNEIMLAEHFASYNSSEAGASEGPLEVAKQLFLNQQLLTNLEGLKGWLKRGMRLKRTSAKGKKQLQALLTPLVGDESSVGRILDVKKRIDDLQHPEFAEVEQTEAQAFMLEYLKDQLLKANQRTATSQLQYGVLKNFAGGFAGGGYIPQGKWGVVGESGPEVVGGPSTVAQMGGEGVSVIVNGDIINTPPGMQPVEVRGAKTIVQQGSRGYGRRPLGGAKGY